MSGSVLVRVDGVTYASGLAWLMPEGGKTRTRWTREQARTAHASWYAQRAHQTGFWIGPEPQVEGAVTALAHVIEGSIGEGASGAWQVLFACDEGRFAVVRGNTDEILPKGDRVFESLEEALAEFTQTGEGNTVYASAGLVEGARPIKLAEVAERCVLVAAPFGGANARKRLRAALAATLVLSVLGIGALQVWQWYERSLGPQAVHEPQRVEEVIREGVDAPRFLRLCAGEQALAPALPPMWNEVSVSCWADAGAIDEVAGSLDSGALFARWRMGTGNAALARRLAETRLSRWDLGAVLLGTAWGAVAVAAPTRRWEGEQPSTLLWREALDRSVGTLGQVSYQQTDKGFLATLRTAYPVSMVGRRLESVAWLDLLSAVRTDALWEYQLRRVEPRVVLREEGVAG